MNLAKRQRWRLRIRMQRIVCTFHYQEVYQTELQKKHKNKPKRNQSHSKGKQCFSSYYKLYLFDIPSINAVLFILCNSSSCPFTDSSQNKQQISWNMHFIRELSEHMLSVKHYVSTLSIRYHLLLWCMLQRCSNPWLHLSHVVQLVSSNGASSLLFMLFPVRCCIVLVPVWPCNRRAIGLNLVCLLALDSPRCS